MVTHQASGAGQTIEVLSDVCEAMYVLTPSSRGRMPTS